MFWLTDPDAADPGFYLDPILLKPAARGTVRLRSADPADPPRITLPDVTVNRPTSSAWPRATAWPSRSPIDPRSAALSSEPAPDLPSDRLARDQHLVENAYSIPHVVGTCRMGPSPADGDVVDHLGRVHGIDGLHVIDASIIPDAPSGFPHVITIMAAEHLAARLPL